MKNEIASVVGAAIGMIGVYLLKCGLDTWFGLPSWLNWILAVVLMFVAIMVFLYLWSKTVKKKK